MSFMGDSHELIAILRTHFAPDLDRIRSGVEIGCHRGALAARLLREFPSLRLWMVDSWCEHAPGSCYRLTGDSLSRLSGTAQLQHMQACKAATDFAAERRLILRLPSIEAAAHIESARFAFVFLDGDHSLAGVRQDIATWWPRIEPGGLLCGHDYTHPRNARGRFGVRQAVDEFVARERVQLGHRGSCWWAIRPSQRGRLTVHLIRNDVVT